VVLGRRMGQRRTAHEHLRNAVRHTGRSQGAAVQYVKHHIANAALSFAALRGVNSDALLELPKKGVEA